MLAFHYCDKISERNNFKGGKVYFGSLFQRSQSMVSPDHCRPETRLNIIAGSAEFSEAARFLVLVVAKKQRGRVRDNIPPSSAPSQ
jgi:hypothetical protein